MSMHFQCVLHPGSLNYIIQETELRNLLPDDSGTLLLCRTLYKCYPSQ